MIKAGTTLLSVLPISPITRLSGATFFVRLREGFGHSDQGGLQRVAGVWSNQDRTGIDNSQRTVRAKIQLALRQEDVGEGKQRLIGDENGIAILSLSKTKRELEKVQE